MKAPSVDVVRREDGSFRLRLLDEAGEVVPITPGSIGLKRSAKERAQGRKAMQAVLEEMYERQQADAG